MTIINYSDIQDNDCFECDVCIVGSGMSAQSLAVTINEFNNKRITIIESGKVDYEENVQLLNNFHNTGIVFRENFKIFVKKHFEKTLKKFIPVNNIGLFSARNSKTWIVHNTSKNKIPETNNVIWGWLIPKNNSDT